MLKAAFEALPEWYAYLYSAYSGSFSLFWCPDVISSQEGVQQGDPVGLLLFCLTAQTLMTACRTEFKVGYLDDFTLGDDPGCLAKEVARLEERAASLGLTLNVTKSKCEIISVVPPAGHSTLLTGFKRVEVDKGMLLGFPFL